MAKKEPKSYTLEPTTIKALAAHVKKSGLSASYHTNLALKEYLKRQKAKP